MSRIYFFGCWNESGHFLFAPNKGRVPYSIGDKIVYYCDRVHVDGTLAPRKPKPRTRTFETYGDTVVWQGMGVSQADRDRIHYDSEEYPQGKFLRHELDSGFTAIQWWDRCQGDKRSACNSTVLLEGKHKSEQMLVTLYESFPHVAKNLEAHGVQLVEVRLP